jgi:hypothetical protein
MTTVTTAAIAFQTEGLRKAQNSKMISYYFTASVTSQIMDKIILKDHLYTIKTNSKETQDGVLLLKVLIVT